MNLWRSSSIERIPSTWRTIPISPVGSKAGNVIDIGQAAPNAIGRAEGVKCPMTLGCKMVHGA